jgi:hypothetical protein
MRCDSADSHANQTSLKERAGMKEFERGDIAAPKLSSVLLELENVELLLSKGVGRPVQKWPAWLSSTVQ